MPARGLNRKRLVPLLMPFVFAVVSIAPARAAKLYWPEFYSSGIKRCNPDGSDLELLLQFQHDLLLTIGSIAIDSNSGRLYFTTRSFFTKPGEGVYRSNLDGTAVEQLVASDDAGAIAVDRIGSKVYWYDSVRRMIQRANLDGSNVEDVISTTAGTIVVDSVAAKLYWLGGSPSRLRRANLDGSGVEDLLAEVIGPYALDLQANQVYWIDFLDDVIRRASLDGSNIEDLVVGYVNIPEGIALDLDRGKIYWADQVFGIHRANLDGSNVERVGDFPISSANAPLDIAVVVFGSCGDGSLDTFEECDDGNHVNGDGCQADCLQPRCGDGIVDAGEACEDRNDDDGDGCSSICEVEPGWICQGALSVCSEICGDSIVVGSEECDDGNTVDSDGCQGNCRLSICGDGIVDPNEECDDGDTYVCDGCSSRCVATAVCNDGPGALFRAKRTWWFSHTNSWTSGYSFPPSGKSPEMAPYEPPARAYVGETPGNPRFTAPKSFIKNTTYYFSCGSYGCGPYTLPSIGWYSYWNARGSFRPQNPNAPTTTTTIRFATTMSDLGAPPTAMGAPVTPTTTWGGRYDHSRGGSIMIWPGSSRFGGTMRFLNGPSHRSYQLVTSNGPFSSVTFPPMPLSQQLGTGVEFPIGEVELYKQGFGYRLTDRYYIDRLIVGTTSMGGPEYYVRTVNYLVTRAPYTTGKARIWEPLGHTNTIQTATGYDNRTAAGLNGNISLVHPRLVHAYTVFPPSSGKPIRLTWSSARMQKIDFRFLPEPARAAMLVSGLATLACLYRLRTR